MKNIFICFVLFILASCTTKKDEQPEQIVNHSEDTLILNDEKLKSIVLSTDSIQKIRISNITKFNGKIDVPPQNLASVSCALGGYIKSTKLLPGMHFTKGEIIAVMEDNQYIQLQQDYLTAKAQLENAEAEYSRQKELNKSKASSDKNMEQAMASFQSLKISRNALAEKLRMINIDPQNISVDNIRRTINLYAPFDGYVSNVFVNIGKYVTPSDVLFELVNPRDLHLNLKIFEKDLANIQIGQRLIAYTNSDPGKKYHAEVILIGKNLSADRTVEVHAHFDSYSERLIPGMYMNAQAETQDTESWAIPEEAILTYEGKFYVFEALDKGKFRLIEVQTGNTGSGWTALVNADKLAGKSIVVKGAYTLLMALKNKSEE